MERQGIPPKRIATMPRVASRGEIMHHTESHSENRLVVYHSENQLMTVVQPRSPVPVIPTERPRVEPSEFRDCCPTCGRAYQSASQQTYHRTSYVHPHYFLTLGDAAHGDADEYFNLARSAFNASYYKRFFREDRKIGGGAYGSVFLCQHLIDSLELGQYAIKKVPVGDDKNWLKKKLGEVRALERITQHPNIVQYHHVWLEQAKCVDFGPEVPTMFVLMQYANGGSLADRLWNSSSAPPPVRKAKVDYSPLTELEIWWMLQSIAAGLCHLHAHSILHNDLKPANILLDFDPRSSDLMPTILLTDFGESTVEATPRNAQKRSGGTGTLGFMAPELLQQDSDGNYVHAPSEASDMWSLGITLYCMCCGAIPWDPDKPWEPDASMYSLPQSEAGTAHSRELAQLIQFMVQFEPSCRPTAQQVSQVEGCVRAACCTSSSRTYNTRNPSSPPSPSAAENTERALVPVALNPGAAKAQASVSDTPGPGMADAAFAHCVSNVTSLLMSGHPDANSEFERLYGQTALQIGGENPEKPDQNQVLLHMVKHLITEKSQLQDLLRQSNQQVAFLLDQGK